MHWPKGISAKGEVRHQYGHIIDMVPTVLDALGLEPPAQVRGVTQAPLHGVSLRPTFNEATAPSMRITQYFEMFGHRSIYHDGWRAVCPWPGNSFSEGRPFGTPMTAEDLRQLDEHHWQLYHVAEDPTETQDLAQSHREKLHELITLWYVEAGKYDVLPIDGRGQQRFVEPRPVLAPEREEYVYYPDTQLVPENAAAHVLNRSHAIRADVVIPDGGAEGVLLSHGGLTGGYSFYLKDGKLHYVHNYVGDQVFHVQSSNHLPSGRHSLRCEFERTGEPSPREGKGAPGRVQLYVDDELVGQGEIPVTIPIMIGLGGGLSCGRSGPSPVCDDYAGSFAFSGDLERVTIQVGQEAMMRDDEAQMRAAMARQ